MKVFAYVWENVNRSVGSHRMNSTSVSRFRWDVERRNMVATGAAKCWNNVAGNVAATGKIEFASVADLCVDSFRCPFWTFVSYLPFKKQHSVCSNNSIRWDNARYFSQNWLLDTTIRTIWKSKLKSLFSLFRFVAAEYVIDNIVAIDGSLFDFTCARTVCVCEREPSLPIFAYSF